METSGEAEQVARAQRGDPDAWAELYQRYHTPIYRYLLVRLERVPEAEDLAAQVFLKAMESISRYRWRGVPFSAWLFRIAQNLLIDLQRRATTRQRYLMEAWRTNPPPPSPEDEAISSLERQELARTIVQLTPAQREVVQLRFAGGLSTAEVAAAMGKSIPAVKALQHSALVNLRKILRRDEPEV